MEQTDNFSQKRMELMIDMATKKLQQEINSLKEQLSSVHNEIGSVKSQMSRIQFQPPQPVQRTLVEEQSAHVAQQNSQQKKDIKIVDCRPDGERKEEFVSGSAKNAELVRPRFGDYQPADVSIDKFFYFGRK